MSLTAFRRDPRTGCEPSHGPRAWSRTWATVRECGDLTARSAGYMAFIGSLLLALHLVINSF